MIKKIVHPEAWQVEDDSHLTVKQLKEILQDIPDDTEVCVDGDDYNWVGCLCYNKEKGKFSLV